MMLIPEKKQLKALPVFVKINHDKPRQAFKSFTPLPWYAILVISFLFTSCEEAFELIPRPESGSCEKPPLSEEEIKARIDKLPLELVWRKPFREDSLCRSSPMQPVAYQDKVLFYIPTPYTKFRCHNGANGDVVWNWSQWLSHVNPNRVLNQFLYQHYWLYDARSEMGLIDMHTGQTKWQSKAGNKYGYSTLFGDYIYYSTEKHVGSDCYNASLSRTPVNNFTSHKITEFPFSKQDRIYYEVIAASTWTSPWGDEMAVFNVKGYNEANHQPSVHFNVYNITADSLYYRANDIAPYIHESHPVIIDNHAYFLTAATAHCYDLVNRKSVWSKNWLNEKGNAGYRSIVTDNSNMYLSTSNGHVKAYDLTTGKELWHHYFEKRCEQHEMKLYRGVLYLTNSDRRELIGIKASDGTLLLQMKSYNRASAFQSGVAISEQLNQLYVTDGCEVMAFEIPENWHYDTQK